jgi:hypothetical protein
MTLNTKVFILDRIDCREVFVKCNQLIGAHEGIEFKDEPMGDDGRRSIWNRPGRGLCALLDVDYRPDGPLTTEGDHHVYCEPDDEDSSHGWCFAHWLQVSFDTTYSYHGPEGGCGDLHARLVAELGRWLDSKGVRWSWENEFTGEVHQSYEGLDELGAGGLAALEWFATEAAPAIAAMIRNGS